MKKRVILNSPRVREIKNKERKALGRRMGFFFVSFIILFLGLGFLSRVGSFNIEKVTISGNKIVESKDISKIVEEDLKGRYLFLFQKTNFLIYPKNKIKKDLAERYKRLKEISFDASDANNLKINVSEYKGEYLWCGDVIPALKENTEDNRCYFVDDNGYVFDEAPYFSGQVYFKFYGPTDNHEKIVGSQYLPGNFQKIVTFKEHLEKMNLHPTNFWIIPYNTGDEGSFSLSGEPVISPYVIFNMDSDFEKLAENLQSALSIEPLHTDIVKKFPSLSYLDLRFGNKVYYKFKQD